MIYAFWSDICYVINKIDVKKVMLFMLHSKMLIKCNTTHSLVVYLIKKKVVHS